jgi:ABC-type lipoprotein export system ATPase subunit
MQHVAEEAPRRVGGLSVRCQGLVHLYKTFEGHDVVALQGVDLAVDAGERVAFLGPSGSGKSTLLTLFGGIQRPSAGKIFLGDEEISRMSERQLTRVRASRVSTMLQGATRNLLHYATARQNLRFSRAARNDPDHTLGDAELLRRVGLESKGDQVVSSMSGGERQRLALACSVTSAPQLLLADEPTSQLSHEDRDHMLELIHGLGNDFGTTILVVTHQPEVAATFPRTVTMRGGRVGMEGRAGAEYVVVGAEGVVHLPAHIARDWPQGTLVRIEPEHDDRLLLSRGEHDEDDGEDLT